eukprot:m.1478164 g.1478164  ORF g.1478164 m.1478164 type:complete len:2116 (+) comp25164_c0_seq4:202-6549(+)
MEGGEPPAKRLKLQAPEANETVTPLPTLPGASGDEDISSKTVGAQNIGTAAASGDGTTKAGIVTTNGPSNSSDSGQIGKGLPVLPTSNSTSLTSTSSATSANSESVVPTSNTSAAVINASPNIPTSATTSSSALLGIPPLPTLGNPRSSVTAEGTGSNDNAVTNIAGNSSSTTPVVALGVTAAPTRAVPTSQVPTTKSITSLAATPTTTSSVQPAPPVSNPSAPSMTASAGTVVSTSVASNGLPPLAGSVPSVPIVPSATSTANSAPVQLSGVPALPISSVPTATTAAAVAGLPPLPTATTSTAAAVPVPATTVTGAAATMTTPTASTMAAVVPSASGTTTTAAPSTSGTNTITPVSSTPTLTTAPATMAPTTAAAAANALGVVPTSMSADPTLGAGLPPLPAGDLGLPKLCAKSVSANGLPALGGSALPATPSATTAALTSTAAALPNLVKGAPANGVPVLATPAGLPLVKPKPGTPVSMTLAAGVPTLSSTASSTSHLSTTPSSVAGNLGIPPLPSMNLKAPNVPPTSTTLLSSAGVSLPTSSTALTTTASSSASSAPGTATLASLGLTMPPPLTSLSSSMSSPMPGLPPLSSTLSGLDLPRLPTPTSSSLSLPVSAMSRAKPPASGSNVLSHQQHAILQQQQKLGMSSNARGVAGGSAMSLPVPGRSLTPAQMSAAAAAAAQRQRMQAAQAVGTRTGIHPGQPRPSGGEATSGDSDNRRRAIQQQLLLLIHAHKCHESAQCSIQHCGTMKRVLQHMSTCKEGRTCQYAHCGSSRQIIAHYSHCKNPTCPICAPLRKSTQARVSGPNGMGMPNSTARPGYAMKGNHYDGMGNGNRSSGAAPPSHLPMSSAHAAPASTGGSTSTWHGRLNQMHRFKLRQKLVEALTACVTQKDQQQKQADIKGLAKRIEEQVYQEATKQEDYYHLLAEKIYKLKKARPPVPDSKVPPASGNPATMMAHPTGNGLGGMAQLPPSNGSMMPGLPSLPPALGRAANSYSSLPTLNLPVAPVVPPNPSKASSASSSGGSSSGSAVRPRAPRRSRPAVATKVWTPDELLHHFLPVIKKIRSSEDAEAFHEPVDPEALKIPDYFDIITHPMDLSTITMRLEEGKYKDPREILDDLNLMWTNAWKYNRKGSRIHKITTKLSEITENIVDPVMKRLGYCCGLRRLYTPSTLYCLAKNICIIQRDVKYKKYTKDVNNPVTYCTKCWGEAEDEITLGPEEGNKKILRLEFEDDVNDKEEVEPMITCSECGRKHHEICQLWHKGLTKKFVCKTCRKDSKRKDMQPYTAKKLQKTKLGDHIEHRLRKVLKDKNVDSIHQDITVRVVSIRDKTVTVGEGMKSYYADAADPYPSEFKYRTKALFVWQKQDGVDVCFFGMHVQEYGSDCPAPNTGRVYISYLDSVFYFRPKDMRTIIYKELLVGYLEHCRSIGYSYAHIWACPPSPGDDYIFHCHPPDQKVPKPKRLQDWYKSMLQMAQQHSVIHSWMDMQSYVRKEEITCARQISFFEGDYWPGVIEEKVKAIQAEEKESSAATGGKGGKKGSKKGKKTKAKAQSKKSKAAGKKGKVSLAAGEEELGDRCLEVLEKHKDVFFVAYLRDPAVIDVSKPIKDPDPDMLIDLMDGRDGFLVMCRDEHREFSTIRRARHSSMVLLYALHNADSSDFNYSCNQCEQPIGAMDYRWHCKSKECNDFDLCEKCYKEVGHPHEMEQLGFGMKQSTEGTSGKSEAELKRIAMKQYVEMLIHACQCKDPLCARQNCNKMKQMIQHSRQCPGPQHSCNVCKQLVALCCYHAKNCRTSNCTIPFCAGIKLKLSNNQRAQANSSMYLQRRRMAAMTQHASGQQPQVASSASSSGGASAASSMGGQQNMGAAMLPSVSMPSSSVGGTMPMSSAPSRATNPTKEQMQMQHLKLKASQLDQGILKLRHYLQQLQAREHNGALSHEEQAQKATAATKLNQFMVNRRKISEVVHTYLQRNGQMSAASMHGDAQKKHMLDQLNGQLMKYTKLQREQLLQHAITKLRQAQGTAADVLKLLSPIERHILSMHRMKQAQAQQQQQQQLLQRQQLQQNQTSSGGGGSSGAFQYQQPNMQHQAQQSQSQQGQSDRQQAPQAGDLLGSMADRL